MARVEVRVLGRPSLVIDEMMVPLTGRQLTLALRLAFGGHTPTSVDRLLELWPEGARSEGALRVALTRLRQAIGPQTVHRLDGGYVLSPTADVDARRFEQQLSIARNMGVDIAERRAALDDAIGLWTGPAFDGAERVDWVSAEAVRLDDLFEEAVDQRFELALEHGGAEILIADLRAALDRQPTRERRVELLATALYRSGRQTDALQSIATASHRLRHDFGLEPSPSLRSLETRILQHDPSLAKKTRSTERVSPHAPADTRVRAARALMAAGAADEAAHVVESLLDDARGRRDPETTARALLLRAQVITAIGRDDPNPSIDEAQGIARELQNGRLLARAASIRFGSGVPLDKTTALIELAEPLDLLAVDAPERIDLLCAAAVIIGFTDAGPAAQQLIDTARRTHAAIGTPRSDIVWCAARVIVGAIDGHDIDELTQLADRAEALAREERDPVLLTVAFQAVLRTAYMRGDLARVDSVLDDLDRAASEATLAFGRVRVALCTSTNAIARGELAIVPELIDRARDLGLRLRTHAAAAATVVQDFMLRVELGTHEDQIQILRSVSADRGPDPWLGALAAYGNDDDHRRLLAHLDDLPRNDSFLPCVAFAALSAAQRDDARLGHWCREPLETAGDQTVMVGFGTAVFGFAPYFLGLAQLATGDLDDAAASLDHAERLSVDVGAHLWTANAQLWHADTLLRSGGGAPSGTVEELLGRATANPALAGSRRLQEQLAAVRSRCTATTR